MFRFSLLIFCIYSFFMPHWDHNDAQAQFRTKRSVAQIHFRQKIQNQYVHTQAQPRTSPYLVLRYRYIFYQGSSPFDYKVGLIWQEPKLGDPRMLKETQLFTQRTLGRARPKGDPFAKTVNPETFGGLSHRRPFFDGWAAWEASINQNTDRYKSHGGLLLQAAVKFRVLRTSSAKIYLTHQYRYGDKFYIQAWFGAQNNVANVELTPSIFESNEQITYIQKLSKHHLFELHATRATLRGVAKQSVIINHPRDNRIQLSYIYQF